MATSAVKPSPVLQMMVDVNGRTYAVPKRPTAVIVVDGFDPAYLEHGFANGTLPNLKSFLEHGFVGTADCSMPSTTNTNNTSIVTGVPPAVHGINGNYYLDPETGREIMITDASRLRCDIILGAFSRIGVSTAVVTAKDKLLKVLAHGMTGVGFSAEYAGRANLATNGIDNVEELVGRPQPDQYSADLSLFVLDAGVKILSSLRPQLLYLSTSDYVQHKHAPGEPEADAFHNAVDVCIGQLVALGATVAVTADHGMNDKANADGAANVIYLEDELNARFGAGTVRVICPIADPFVRHHGALGSFVRVHLRKPADVAAMMAFTRTLPGIELVLDKQQVCAQFDLPLDREGDFGVFSDRDTVVGARREDHDLSQLAGHRLRSRGVSGSRKFRSCCHGRSMPRIASAPAKDACTITISSISPSTASNRRARTHSRSERERCAPRAAVYEAPNTPFVFKEFPLRPAKCGEVLVRVTMSTICHSDIHSYEGRRPNPCPGILGHEIIGLIEEIGEGIGAPYGGW